MKTEVMEEIAAVLKKHGVFGMIICSDLGLGETQRMIFQPPASAFQTANDQGVLVVRQGVTPQIMEETMQTLQGIRQACHGSADMCTEMLVLLTTVQRNIAQVAEAATLNQAATVKEFKD